MYHQWFIIFNLHKQLTSIKLNRLYVPFHFSGQQFPAGERTNRGLSYRVLQRVFLQDLGLQSRRGDAEVLQVCLHVWGADGQGDDKPGGPRTRAPITRSVRDPAVQEEQ